MLDNRVHTFLTLCKEMNYRRTARLLNMTQPAVTRHIHVLEEKYGVRLFLYDGRTLTKTPEADLLERHLRIQCAEETELLRSLHAPRPEQLRIGATKTIGECVIAPMVERFVRDTHHLLDVTVANTAELLARLESGLLDFALIEGRFDKSRYGSLLLRRESFVGVCAASHPFAGRELSIRELLPQTLILREQGSGTRDIWEQALRDYGYTGESFARTLTVSSPSLIRHLVAGGTGITFAFRSLADSSPGLSVFTLRELSILREFNYVFLDERIGLKKIRLFEGG